MRNKMATSTTGNNSALSPFSIYYDETMIPALIQQLVYGNLIDRKALPTNYGQSINFIIPGIQPQNATILAEGIPVTPGPTTETVVTKNVSEYGNVFAVSSLLFKTSVIKAFTFLSEQVSQAGSYAYDYLARLEIFNPSQTTFGVNLFGAGGASSLNNLTSSSILTLKDVAFAKSFLLQNAVKPRERGLHVGVTTVGQAYDLRTDTSTGGWLDQAKQNPLGIKDIKQGWGEEAAEGDVEAVGAYAGVGLWATALNPVVYNNTTGINNHYAAFWGKDSIAGIALGGEGGERGFEIETKTASKDGPYDVINRIPLAMGYSATLGFKNLSQDYVNVGNQRVVQVASASAFF
jgi:N4-gp56 family major capsid protein